MLAFIKTWLDMSRCMDRCIIIQENLSIGWPGQIKFLYTSPQWLPYFTSSPYFQGYDWFRRKPRHGCPYHDRSTSMLDSWKGTITSICLCRSPPNVPPFCCREKCESLFVRPYYFLPLINRPGFVSVTPL